MSMTRSGAVCAASLPFSPGRCRLRSIAQRDSTKVILYFGLAIDGQKHFAATEAGLPEVGNASAFGRRLPGLRPIRFLWGTLDRARGRAARLSSSFRIGIFDRRDLSSRKIGGIPTEQKSDVLELIRDSWRRIGIRGCSPKAQVSS